MPSHPYMGFSGEVLNKPSVEVHEAKEGLDIRLVFWSRPLLDFCDLDQIHGNFVFQND